MHSVVFWVFFLPIKEFNLANPSNSIALHLVKLIQNEYIYMYTGYDCCIYIHLYILLSFHNLVIVVNFYKCYIHVLIYEL